MDDKTKKAIEELRFTAGELMELPNLLDADNIAMVSFKLGQLREVIASIASDLEKK